MNRLRCVGGALALLAIAAPTFAQDEDETIKITTGWEQGDRICFDLVKQQATTQADKQISEMTLTGHHVFDILVADGNEFVVRWTPNDYEIDSSQPIPDFARRVIRIAEDIQIEFVFDAATVSLLDIRNHDQVKRQIDQALSKLLLEIENAGVPKAFIEQATAPVFDIMKDSQLAASLMSSDLLGMFYPYGFELFVHDGSVFETPLPNIAGGEPLNARDTWYVSEANPEAPNLVVIERIQEVDPDSLVRLGQDMAKLTNGGNDAEQGIRQAIDDIELIRESIYVYDTAQRLLTYAYTAHETITGDVSSVDTWEWTVVECDEKH